MGQQPSTPVSENNGNANGDSAGSRAAGQETEEPQASRSTSDDIVKRLFGKPKSATTTAASLAAARAAEAQHDHAAMLRAIHAIQRSETAMCDKARKYHQLAIEAKSSRYKYDREMHQRYAAQYLAMTRRIVQVRTTLLTLDQMFEALEQQKVTIDSVRALDRGNAMLAQRLKEVSLVQVERTQDEMEKLVEEAQERAAVLASAQGFSVEAGDVSLDDIEQEFGDAVGPGYLGVVDSDGDADSDSDSGRPMRASAKSATSASAIAIPSGPPRPQPLSAGFEEVPLI